MSRRLALEKAHGTYREFEDAVWNALGEISVDEAQAACHKYLLELREATILDLEDLQNEHVHPNTSSRSVPKT